MSPAIPSPPCLFGGVASLPPAPLCASHHTCRLRHCKSNSLNNPNNRTILPSQPLAAFAAIRRRRGRRRRHWRWLRVFLSLTVCGRWSRVVRFSFARDLCGGSMSLSLASRGAGKRPSLKFRFRGDNPRAKQRQRKILSTRWGERIV